MCEAIVTVRYKSEANEADRHIECNDKENVSSLLASLNENDQVVSYSVFLKAKKYVRVSHLQEVPIVPLILE